MFVKKPRRSRMPDTQSAPAGRLGTEPPHQSGICGRCGGLLIEDHGMEVDLRNGGRPYSLWVRRCLQCGDMIDEIILRNRSFPHYVLQEVGRRPP